MEDPRQVLCLFEGSQCVLCSDAEGELKLWDLETRREASSISQGRNGVVKCWHLHSGSSIHSLDKPAAVVQSVLRPSQLAPQHKQGSLLHVLAGYEDGTVALWDIRRTDKYVSADKLHSESVMSLAAAPSCRSGFSGAADDVLAAFDISIPEGRISLARKMTLAKPGIADVAIRPDNRIAASAGWDGKIRVWHAVKCRPLAILKWHNQQVAAVTFSSDSQSLAAAGRDNQISLWNLYPPA
eukprot:gene2594-2896_t